MNLWCPDFFMILHSKFTDFKKQQHVCAFPKRNFGLLNCSDKSFFPIFYFLTVIYFWLENKNHPHKVPKLCLQQKINGDRQGISCADRTVLIFTTHLCIAHFFSPTLGVQSDKELWFFLQAPANSQVISINVHFRKLG